MMDQPRMWRTEGIDLESVMIRPGDDADADEDEEASLADDGSMQNVEDWGHSTRECEDWTVYFRPVKYDNGQKKCNGKRCIRSGDCIVISDNISKPRIYGEIAASAIWQYAER